MFGLGVMEAGDAALELVDEGGDRRVLGVEEEDLLRGDDGLDVLEVDDDGALAAEHDGGVGEEGVEDAEVARGEAGAAHDRVLPCLHELGLAGGVDQKPWPDPCGLLSEPRVARGGVHLVVDRSGAWLGRGRGRKRTSCCCRSCCRSWWRSHLVWFFFFGLGVLVRGF